MIQDTRSDDIGHGIKNLRFVNMNQEEAKSHIQVEKKKSKR